LQKRFSEVEKASDAYWDALDAVTASISDKSRRAAEQQRNEAARKKWDQAYDSARAQIARAVALRDRGADFHKVLLASAMRRQIAEYTATLDSIAKEADVLLDALASLTDQGRLIVDAGT
jgi:hypothetical protein